MSKKVEKDYLAIIHIPGGSSHGRAAKQDDAIELAVTYFFDWSHIFDLRKASVVVHLYDVTGIDGLSWSDSSPRADKGVIEPIYLGHKKFITGDARTRPKSSSRKYIKECKKLAADAELKLFPDKKIG